MKGISSLLIVALVASVYGDFLEKSEWEALEKLQQENASKKEKVLSFLREIGRGLPTENEKYNEFLSRSTHREVVNDDKNIEKWRPGIPPNILSLIKKYKQNSLNGEYHCKGHQTKNQKEDDSDDLEDIEDSNVDIDGEYSDQNKGESPIKYRRSRSASRKDKSSSDEDDSNSLDDNSSDEENNCDESNSDDNSNNSNDDKKNSKKRRENKSKGKNSDESNSDDKSDDSDSDEKDPRYSRKEKPIKKNSDESDSDNKSGDSDSNKSENSSEEKKWRWILNRADHQAKNKTPTPWNWQPNTIWELEAKRAELKNRLIGIAQIEKVIKFLENRTDEFKRRGQWERTIGLVKAIAVHKKLLAENINAVSRICNITEVEPNKISELIIKCAISYSPRWRKLSHVGRPISENKNAILNNSIPLQEFLAAHRNLNRPYITQILNAKGLVKEGEQVNGIISWKSQPDKSGPPSDNAGPIGEETSLNSTNPSDNKKNGPGANVDESAVSDKDQAPETNPTNGKEGNGSKNLNDQSDSGSQVQSKPESSSAGDNGVNPSNNENEIPGSNDDQPANDANQPPQSVPKSDEPKNLDLKPEVSSSSDDTAKEVADINKLGDLKKESSPPKNVTDEGQNTANSDGEVGESSTDSNNQTDTTLGTNETSDDTSSQTGSTTSQTSEISENTDTTEPRSSSTLPTEGTTDTIQNANSESDTLFNTTAPKSTSLIDE